MDNNFFHENGYLVIPNFLSQQDIQSLKDEIRRLHDHFIKNEKITQRNVFIGNSKQDKVSGNYFLNSAGRITFFFEERANEVEDPLWKINKVGHALHDKSEPFKKVSFCKEIHDMCVSLMEYKDPTIVQSMYIFKPPHIGGEVTSHQDETFIGVNNPESSCLGFWMALEKADKENACLWAIPGSHKAPILKQWVRTDTGTHKEPKEIKEQQSTGDDKVENINQSQTDNRSDELPLKFITINEKNPFFSEEEASKYVPLEVNAGDLVVLHGRLVHKSNSNYSSRSREIYTLHCVDRNEYLDSNWLQRDDGFPSYWE